MAATRPAASTGTPSRPAAGQEPGVATSGTARAAVPAGARAGVPAGARGGTSQGAFCLNTPVGPAAPPSATGRRQIRSRADGHEHSMHKEALYAT